MWMTSPLVYLGLLAAGLGLCLFLFVTVKQEIAAVEGRLGKRIGAIEKTLETVLADLDQVRQGVREAEERAGVLVPPVPPKSGLNLSKRTQVLRLFRRGDPPSQIAATLGLPQAEVDLLLKVHRIVLEIPRPAAPDPATSRRVEAGATADPA